MKKINLLFILFTLFVLLSCTKTENNTGRRPGVYEQENVVSGSERDALKYLQWLMSEIYYWNETAPKLDYNSFNSVEKFFYKSLVPKDRWSWMTDGKSYMSSEAGVYTTYGCSLGQAYEYYNDYSVYVRYVFKDSPFDKAGITRGWKILEINGVATEELIDKEMFASVFNNDGNTFLFMDIEGNTHKKTINKSQIQTTSVLFSKIFTKEDFDWLQEDVGYINYLTFNRNMMNEITESIAKMKAGNVKKLILDLRYNGGGSVDAAELFCNLLSTSACNNKVLVKMEHNKKYAKWDTTILVNRTAEALDLDDLYVISGEGTASASEIIINGLKPLMPVHQVGDTTYGKPNGMYVQTYPEINYDDPEYYKNVPDYVFLPICFYSVNSEGKGDYENGLLPDNYRPDYPCTDWNNDEIVVACLKKIATGSYPPLQYPQIVSTSSVNLFKNGVLNTPEKENGYGRFVVRRKLILHF